MNNTSISRNHEQYGVTRGVIVNNADIFVPAFVRTTGKVLAVVFLLLGLMHASAIGQVYADLTTLFHGLPLVLAMTKPRSIGIKDQLHHSITTIKMQIEVDFGNFKLVLVGFEGFNSKGGLAATCSNLLVRKNIVN